MNIDKALEKLANNIVLVADNTQKVLGLSRLTVYDRRKYNERYKKLIVYSSFVLEIIKEKNNLDLEYLKHEMNEIQRYLKKTNKECEETLVKLKR